MYQTTTPIFGFKRHHYTNYQIHPLYLNFDLNEVDELLGQYECELDLEFPGFVEIYELLSQIIPINYTIIDLGCYMATQCWYFRHHEKYVGVDVITLKRFTMPNTYHYISTIKDFIKYHGTDFPRATTFAICNYVSHENMGLTKYYPNCFCFYPCVQPNRIDILKSLKKHDDTLGELNGPNN